MIVVNLTKAKAITKDRLRAERAPIVAPYMRATEANQDTTAPDNKPTNGELKALR
jgi:hypothetical protein